ncbi:MAG: hypothetical protein IJW00_01775 [Clostridia bacterium]|nr:hypothetical protein [Clostridia bacterium]
MAKIKEGQSVSLSVLQRKMLPAITLPMGEDCPTALRYALAKYDAGMVAEAYEGLYNLYLEGALEDQTP